MGMQKWIFRILAVLAYAGSSTSMGQPTSKNANNIEFVTFSDGISDWTLERCIQQALSQNIDIQLSMLSEEQAALAFEQATRNFGPELGGSVGQFYQSGRSIDRFSNQFVQSTIGSNNFQLQGSLLLFNGLQNQNARKQAKQNWMASGADLESIRLSVTLQVASAFVLWLQSNELEIAAASVLNGSKLQLDRGQKIYDVGASNQGALLSLKAQYASDLASMTNAQNNKISALQNLKQLIRLPASQSFEPAMENFGWSATEFPLNAQELIDTILERRPDYHAAQYRCFAAQYACRSAKGALFPILSLGGSLGSVYSSNAKLIDGSISGFRPIGRVQGSNEIVEGPEYTYSMQTKAFRNQLGDNFGQSLGLNMTIPIYSGLQRHTQLKNANLALNRAELNLERTKQAIENEVLSAYNNYLNADKRYVANKENVDLQQQNEQSVLQRLNAGAASYFEYQVANTNYVNAYQNFISAKYERSFRRLVLDFYLMPPIADYNSIKSNK